LFAFVVVKEMLKAEGENEGENKDENKEKFRNQKNGKEEKKRFCGRLFPEI